MSFNVSDIENLIPQKPPFVMVDKLIDFQESKVKSTLVIREDNLLVNNGLFIESGIIENMAQTVALHTGYEYHLKGESAPTGYLGSIKKIQIFEQPKVGSTITTTAEILQEFNGVTLVEVQTSDTHGNIIASGQLKTVIAN